MITVDYVKEDYVSFEIAKLLKEKGFDWECIGYYVDYEPNDVKYSFLGETNSTWESRCCSTPTSQMAMRWLREEHKIAINIGWGEVFEENYQWWCIILNQNSGEILRESEYCKTYEEAAEAAIKYCLGNLI